MSAARLIVAFVQQLILKNRIPCWNCFWGTMRPYAQAGYYRFYRCKSCGSEKAILRDRDCNPTRPDSPPAFPYFYNRGPGGREDAKEKR
jgi:hypothetical protein